MNFLERQPDAIPSIGNDAAILLAFKAFCGLPTDASWTESDTLLKGLLASAERLVDELSGCPFQVRTFKYTFDSFSCLKKNTREIPRGWNFFGPNNRFYSLKLPVWPIAADPLVTITWLDDTGASGTWTQGTDFDLFGANTLTPEIIFPYAFNPPSTHTIPYPFVASFKAGGGLDIDVAKLCVFELASAYYRSPEMMVEKEPYVSITFQANLDHLKGSFLG